MTTVSIQQFRATLASRSEQSALVRTYRRLARRPEMAAGLVTGEWAAWPTVATPVASA
ncbi:MAG TPA: hypothetical protein VM890_09860 [Longimicrobium sp.]|jgi:hypothetical protein|nr:hypothetical protein [Longimicrobium sp.]